jgi:hypothetical protein
MLLRKHLGGAFLTDVRQEGFERVAVFEFGTRDEMGFDCKKLLIAEIMGKNSNLIFANEDGRIITALRTVDFTTSRLRQILPGMRYEMPPAQEGKSDPLTENMEGFISRLTAAPWDQTAAKFINQSYFGVAPVVAREIVFRAVGAGGRIDDEIDLAVDDKIVDVGPCLAELIDELGENARIGQDLLRSLGGENAEARRRKIARDLEHLVLVLVAVLTIVLVENLNP